MEGQQKKYNIQSAIKALVKKDCEVEKKIKFLKEMEVFEEIWVLWVANEISMILVASYTNKWLWCWVNSQITKLQGKEG